MNDQFAFAIAFDQPNPKDHDQAEHPLPVWQQLTQQIAESLESEGCIGLAHPRWEEFGEGRIFWGTKTECEAVKSVLSSHPVSLYEERNLEAGYYADADGIYYVTTSGDIFGFQHPADLQASGTVSPLMSIPVEAYRTQDVPVEIANALQQGSQIQAAEPVLFQGGEPTKPNAPTERSLDNQSNQFEDLKSQVNHLRHELEAAHRNATAQVSPDVISSLESQNEQQVQRIQALESELQYHQGQVRDLQTLLDRQIDPKIHAELQQKAEAQAETIAQLEQQIVELRQTLKQLQDSESQRISPDDYAQLKQLSVQQTQTIGTLEQQTQTLQAEIESTRREADAKIDPQELEAVKADLDKWMTLANSKVESATYDELNQKVQDQSIQLQTSVDNLKALEQQTQTLQLELKASREDAAQKIDPAKFQALQQESQAQSSVIHELEKQVVILQDEVQTARNHAAQKVDPQELEAVKIDLEQWMTLANSKVDRIEYEAALEQIQKLNAKLSRSWWTRLKDWFQGR